MIGSMEALESMKYGNATCLLRTSHSVRSAPERNCLFLLSSTSVIFGFYPSDVVIFVPLWLIWLILVEDVSLDPGNLLGLKYDGYRGVNAALFLPAAFSGILPFLLLLCHGFL